MAKSMCKDRQKNQILGIFGEYFLSIKRLFVLLRGMKRIVSLLMLAFVLMTPIGFVYTDGINEAENIHKEQFGDECLKALLNKDLGNQL